MAVNYPLNGQIIRKKCYELLTAICGDEIIYDISDAEGLLWSLRNEFAFDSIVHLVTEIAILNRTKLDDRKLVARDSESDGISRRHCGTIDFFLSDENAVPLEFREACNKIIHSVHFVVESNGDPREFPLSSSIVLRGSSNQRGPKRAWVVVLDIIEYINLTLMNFDN